MTILISIVSLLIALVALWYANEMETRLTKRQDAAARKRFDEFAKQIADLERQVLAVAKDGKDTKGDVAKVMEQIRYAEGRLNALENAPALSGMGSLEGKTTRH
ncbi:MAG: hypothetical protein ACPGO3_14575 [Magnetospiraceae bacterium]